MRIRNIFFATLLFSISCNQTSSSTTRIPFGTHPTAGRFYEIRGFKMYAEVYGEGLPVLFIHGNGGSIRDFSHQIPFFAEKYKVIVADSRAQGQSTETGDSLSYEMMADDYAALLDSLQVDSAMVIGWSDGGINALLLAMRHPAKVRKLATSGANLWPDSTAMINEFIRMIEPKYSELKNTIGKTDKQKHEWKLLRLMVEQPHITIPSLASIKCPSLIISGDHDVIRPEHTTLIYQNIPKAYLWIVPNSGHKTLVTYKDDFNKHVEKFFSTPFREISGDARFQ